MTCKNYWDSLGASDEVEFTGNFEIKGKIPAAFKKEVAKLRAERQMEREVNKTKSAPQGVGHTFHACPQNTTWMYTSTGNKMKLVDHTGKENAVPMGGSQNPMFGGIVLPRAFRFLAESSCHPNLAYYVKKLETDYVEKKLSLEIYDTVDGVGFAWMFNIGDELTQTMLDGCGNKLYSLTFKHLKLISHKLVCDYADSNLPIHCCGVTFEEMTRKQFS